MLGEIKTSHVAVTGGMRDENKALLYAVWISAEKRGFSEVLSLSELYPCFE